MKVNVGGIDRALRLIVGLGLIGWGFYTRNWWGAIGIIPLMTGLTRRCPAYAPFGIRTRPAPEN